MTGIKIWQILHASHRYVTTVLTHSDDFSLQWFQIGNWDDDKWPASPKGNFYSESLRQISGLEMQSFGKMSAGTINATTSDTTRCFQPCSSLLVTASAHKNLINLCIKRWGVLNHRLMCLSHASTFNFTEETNVN